MGRASTLEAVLHEELQAARWWQEVAERLVQAVVELRAGEIERLAALDQEAGTRVGALAHRRLRVQEECRRALGLPESVVRLRDLAVRLPAEVASPVARMAADLRTVYERVEHLTGLTARLLEEAVRTSREFLQALAGMEPPEGAYTRRGPRRAPAAVGPLFEGIA